MAVLFAAPPHHHGANETQGFPWSGKLVRGTEMPLKGKYHRFTWNVRRKRSNFGTSEMVDLLYRSAEQVGRRVLKSPPVVLGSISKQCGGKMKPHKSHQTGRDVDILFYALDPEGKPKKAPGFFKYDRNGWCTHPRCKGWSFDLKRNWWLVRTMVWSQRPYVQYIFVSNGLKRLMLNYAKTRGEHPEILKRAALVMSQPGNSSPHADHFHVRIYCPFGKKDARCKNGGKRWPWVKPTSG